MGNKLDGSLKDLPAGDLVGNVAEYGRRTIDRVFKTSDVLTKTASSTILATRTIDTLQGAFHMLSYAFNILLAVVVIMILIASFFLIYNGTYGTHDISNSITTLILAVLVAVSFVILKFTFSSIDILFFSEQSGILREARRILAEDQQSEQSKAGLDAETEADAI